MFHRSTGTDDFQRRGRTELLSGNYCQPMFV
nr:MAG TPA_asm: hypothetical protein [Caudoviricetes sp.]